MRKGLWVTLFPMGYRVVYALLLAGVGIFGAGELFGIQTFEAGELAGQQIEIQQTVALYMAFAIVGILLLAWINFGKIKGKILGGVAFLFYGMIFLPVVGTGGVRGFGQQYLLWLTGKAGYNVDWIVGYELVQILWIVVFSYVLAVILEKWQKLKNLLAVGVLAGLLICMFTETNIPQAGVVIALGYILIALTEYTRKHWEKKKERSSQEYMLWLVPFGILYIILLAMAPKQDEPYDWKFFREMYGKMNENFTILTESVKRDSGEKFVFSMEGFSENSSPMADLLKDNREFMVVQGDRGLTTSVYLSGKVHNVFNGREWTRQGITTKDEAEFDTLETLDAIRQYAGTDNNKYLQVANLDIKYAYFDTKYLFTPLKLTNISGIESSAYTINGGEYTLAEQVGYGAAYGVSYYQLNRSKEDFMEMVETIQTDARERLAETEGEVSDDEDMEVYRQSIRDSYFKEVQLSEETEQYIADVTRDCTTDIQRLQAIEGVLSEYEYTRAPGKLPEWVQSEEAYLDYFLSESKRGFCSHFATAFVLLARAEGFPARYVEGFVVPLKKDKEMAVTSNMVHAWPEVYIEGFGWLAFEPTPGFGSLRYSGWKIRDDSHNDSIDNQENDKSTDEADSQVDAVGLERTDILRILGYGMGIFLLLCVLLLFVERIYRRHRYRHMTMEQQFLVEIRRNLKILTILFGRRMENQTLREWMETLYLSLPQHIVVEGNLVSVRFYQNYLYGNLIITEEMLQQVIEERKALFAWTKQDRKGLYYRIRLRMFVIGL